jgi:hypothetical protein
MAIAQSKSNKGWHKQWFYLKNDADAPLPIFTDRLIEESPESWGWGPIDMEKRRLGDLLKAITLLKHHDLYATSVVGAYHARRVVPRMARALLLYRMTPEASLEGMVLSREPLHNSKIEQHIREAMEVDVIRFEFLISGHPVMRPGPSFVEMVCLSSISSFDQPFLACPILSVETYSSALPPKPLISHYRKIGLRGRRIVSRPKRRRRRKMMRRRGWRGGRRQG